MGNVVARQAGETESKGFWRAVPVAAAAWLLMIGVFGRFLASPRVEPQPPPPVEARIVELPEQKPEPKPAVHEKPAERFPPKVVPQLKAPEPQVQPELVKPVTQPSVSRPEPSPEPVSEAAPPVPLAKAAPSQSVGTENMAARAVYQPIPKMPDDLRAEVISVVAMARFHVNTDGTVSVELIKPTPNPKLNRIILETLRTWKFFPAMRDGKPIPSTQDIRINVDVG